MENFSPKNSRLLVARQLGASVRRGEPYVIFECRSDRTECGKTLGCVAMVKASQLGTPEHIVAMSKQGICESTLEASGANRLLQAPNVSVPTVEQD